MKIGAEPPGSAFRSGLAILPDLEPMSRLLLLVAQVSA